MKVKLNRRGRALLKHRKKVVISARIALKGQSHTDHHATDAQAPLV